MPTKTWTIGEIPTSDDLAKYLNRVQAVRNIFPAFPGMPEVPPDMKGFTYKEANDIELILVKTNEAIDLLEVTMTESNYVYSGELFSGGV